MTARRSSIRVSRVGDLPHRIGEARAALLDHRDPGKRGQIVEEPLEERLLPDGEEVAGEAAREDDVGSAAAEGLVRDRDVAAPRVVDVGDLH